MMNMFHFSVWLEMYTKILRRKSAFMLCTRIVNTRIINPFWHIDIGNKLHVENTDFYRPPPPTATHCIARADDHMTSFNTVVCLIFRKRADSTGRVTESMSKYPIECNQESSSFADIELESQPHLTDSQSCFWRTRHIGNTDAIRE